jgi:methionyl aminopeptidase
MRRAGQVVAAIHERLRAALRPGVSTGELDQLAREVLAERGATSNFLGYGRPPFPAVICTSINDEVVHGVPRADRHLAEGDLVSVDCGAVVDGFHGDAAFSAVVGSGSAEAAHLVAVTEAALAAGIAAARPGAFLHEIGRAVEETVREAGYSVVREYVGHGIGRAMHEPPDVPNYWPGHPGPRLRAGVTLAIEPMVVAGPAGLRLDADGWTVRSAVGALAAHAEHTVVVRDPVAEILTRP